MHQSRMSMLDGGHFRVASTFNFTLHFGELLDMFVVFERLLAKRWSDFSYIVCHTVKFYLYDKRIIENADVCVISELYCTSKRL